MGYFDQSVYMASQSGPYPPSIAEAAIGANGSQGQSHAGHVSSPPLSTVPDFPTPQTSQFLSPRLGPVAGVVARHHFPQNNQLRAVDLSPPAAPGSPSQAQTIRRLTQQNSRIREAWEAERKYLEANRERAEEVYKEERGLMEAERAEWDIEREVLLRQVAALQQQVASLGGDTHLTTKNTDRPANGEELEFALPQVARDGGANLIPGRVNMLPMRDNAPLGGSGSGEPLPITADAAVAHARPSELGQQRNYSRILPPKQSESPPPLSPSVANDGFPPNNPAATVDKDDMTPVPTFDVQEIIPTLEGIPIKAAAVQRSTFTDPKPASSSSPPPAPGSNPSSRTPSPSAKQPGMPKRGSKEQTMRLLAADATDRLTMHAGHTPSHSLSVLPTHPASAVTTASSSSSGGNSTPTLPQQESAEPETDDSAPPEPLVPFSTNEDLPPGGEEEKDHPEPMLEADDDVELKGPLMVRNMPAHDEVFFRRLSDKLEEVSRASAAAVPAVLKDIPEDNGESSKRQENNTRNESGTAAASGTQDAGAVKDKKSSPGSNDSEEMEIPLKIRRTNNFGAPLGEFR